MSLRKVLGIIAAGLLIAGSVFAQGTAPDFSRIVALGDSLTAGYYNGSLNQYGQVVGWAARFAQQAGHPMTLPLISYPGMPPALKLKGFDALTGFPMVGEVSTQMGTLLNPTSQPTDLAVPGQTSVDCLTKVPQIPPSSITDIILGFPSVYLQGQTPKSQVGLAATLQPTFVLLWIGSNDVLGGALTGNPNYTVPPSAFAQVFPAIVGSMAQTGAKMLIFNIPDVTVVPALTKGSALAAMGIPLAPLGIGPKDYVTPYSHQHIHAILAGTAAGPLGPGEVLYASDVPKLQAIVDADNAVIAQTAAQFGFPVFDFHAFLNKAKKHGYKLPDGTKLTTAYLGGLFGLDGVHPTATGYAILANEAIKTVNAFYHTSIKPVNLTKVNLSDSLGFPSAKPVLPLGAPTGSLAPIVDHWVKR